jgi:hypothetical protein
MAEGNFWVDELDIKDHVLLMSKGDKIPYSHESTGDLLHNKSNNLRMIFACVTRNKG